LHLRASKISLLSGEKWILLSFPFPLSPFVAFTTCDYVRNMCLNPFLSLCLAIAVAVCASGIVASPPSPPPLSSEEQPPYSPSSPTPPSVRDSLPPPHYVAHNSLPLRRREQQDRPSLRVLPFRPAPPSLPLPWETPRRVNHEDIVWAGADRHPARRSSAQMPAVEPPIHPHHTNGHDTNRHEYSSPSPPVEREEFWTDGLTDAQRTDAQRPRTEDDQEWDDNVDEAAYEGATAYSLTSYERSNGYFWVSNEASRERRTAAAAATDRAAATDCENRRHRHASMRERMTFGDWTHEEWDQLKDVGGRDLPISVSSISSLSLPSLVSVSPPVQYRNPSPPPSPEPIQLQYVRDGTAGPVYVLQLGPSLRHQPL
jgi:hypothetical protein